MHAGPRLCLQWTPLRTRPQAQPGQAAPCPSQAARGVHRAGAPCLCLNGVLRLSRNIGLPGERSTDGGTFLLFSGKQNRNFQGQHVQSEGPPRRLSGVKSSPAKAGVSGDPGSIPGAGRSPGGGNGHPLQYSRLETPRDRGAQRAVFQRVGKSQTTEHVRTHTRTHTHAHTRARAHTHVHTHAHTHRHTCSLDMHCLPDI